MSTVSVDHWGQMSDFKELKHKYKITDIFLRSLVIKGRSGIGSPKREEKSKESLCATVHEETLDYLCKLRGEN